MTPHEAADAALVEADRLRRNLRRSTSAQVRNADERGQAHATALAWFNSHRGPVVGHLGDAAVEVVDRLYRELIDATGKAAARSTYQAVLSEIRALLTGLRSDAVMPKPSQSTSSNDAPPSFASLVADPGMQAVLRRRWQECVLCLSVGANLAATVMMGGLLEGLLLAKVNGMADKRPVFTATHAPTDRKGKSLPLSEWTLKHYIDVGHDLGWISRTTRDVGAVLRDYRNYVHPQKELSHAVTLSQGDAALWWEVSKTIARELT